MSPRSPEQFAHMRTERQAAILQTALELFADRGYANTSIAAIARKAGMATGLLYNYFASKEALLQALLEKCMHEMTAPVLPLMDRLDSLDTWHLVVDRLFASLKDHPVQWTLYFSLLLQPSMQGRLPANLTEADGQFIEALRQCLAREGVADPHTESMLFHFAMVGAMTQYVMEPSAFSLDQIVATLKDHLGNLRKKTA